ncbi:Telomerase Cajal body protein 1 [Babesia sp. Xinjiang]|uniref:Telomerase Cajal body protein 1 n=1 Tax=Babesia sp. Xinjiang TaxID=462227 RepID=UPI000A2289B7|nr:Telomerase Cajal body protein 1 [Babesia sp. Xinjiang]ORM40544.1 Telomerase Cajal body protein 1 [Babesia sp. Xinjiang]
MRLLSSSTGPSNTGHRRNTNGCDVYVNAAVFSPDGTVFATIFSDARIEVYPLGHTEDEFIGCKEVEPTTNQHTTLSPILNICCHDDREPDSCCFLGVSRGSPIQLYDTQRGQRHFTYKPSNLREEMVETYSLDFHPLGKYFIGGSRGSIHIFDIETPGNNIEMRTLYTNRGKKFGIVSTINHNPHTDTVYACGDYNCLVGVFDHNESRQRSIFDSFVDDEHQMGPITQLKWLSETLLLVGCRADIYLRAYDIRGNTRIPLMRYKRAAKTNQKISFDTSDCAVVSGTSDGDVVAYDISTGELKIETKIAKTVVSSANLHPTLPLLLTSSGTRVFRSQVDQLDDSLHESSIQLWHITQKGNLFTYYNRIAHEHIHGSTF